MNFHRPHPNDQGETLTHKAKRSSAVNFDGSGLLGSVSGRRAATRGASSDARGRGASAGRVVMLAVVAALALLALSASSALATPGITNFWGSIGSNGQTEGGRFEYGPGEGAGGPQGLAVYESTGDVYVGDPANNRVQQFDADGTFIRAWGFDVNSPAAPPGAASFEVCTAKANCLAGVSNINAGPGVGTAGEFSRPSGIAVDQSNGHVYVSDAGFNRVQEFTSTGVFVRAFGQDVVFGAGGANAPAQAEIQSLGVDATAGQFKLSFQGQTTGNIAFDAPAGSVEAALQGLSSIGAGNVTVAGGPGGTAPYTITFTGVFDNSHQPLITTSNGTIPLSGGAATGVITTAQVGSTGFEVCTVAVQCQAGSVGSTAGAFAGMRAVSAVPSGGSAPNAGNILVADAGNQRVQEFTAAGAFVRAFGWNVVAGGPGNDTANPVDEFEVCRAVSFDVCRSGSEGSGVGQFSNGTPSRIAEDRNGNIYTIEKSSNLRVQRFTLPGGVLTPLGPFDCAELCGTVNEGTFRDTPLEVAVDAQGFVYVAKSFLEGTGNPPVVITPEVAGCCSRHYQDRILKVDPAGGGGNGAVVDTMIANTGKAAPGEGDITSGVAPEAISGLAATSSGEPLYFATLGGDGISRQRVYRLDTITGLTASVSVSEVKAATATLEGTITPADTVGQVMTSYHFEYSKNGITWTSAPVSNDVVIGNGSDGGESSSCSAENQASTCHVRQELDGLDIDQTYQCRLAASTTYRGAVLTTSQPCEFTTEANPPTAVTGSAVWSGPPASSPSLTINGRLNPQGARTSYFFQYVSQVDFEASGYAKAHSAPSTPSDAGHGVVTQELTAVAAGLDYSSAYHFRLVASNAAGTTTGADRTVSPPQASDRFYELVSDGDGQGADLPEQRLAISDDGQRVRFIAVAFGELQGAPYITNPNISQRGASGWTVAPMGPDPVLQGGSPASTGNAQVTKTLWLGAVSSLGRQWTVRNTDGSLDLVSPILSPLDRVGVFNGFNLEGGSEDLSSIVFSKTGSDGVTLLSGEPMVRGENREFSNLYEISGAGTPSSSVRVLNRAVNNSIVGGVCGARLGAEAGAVNTATRAVSADGSVVYFSARAGTPATGACGTAFPVRIFKRINGASTVEISACAKTLPAVCTNSGDDYYWGASSDGSRVYFSTARQLTDSDTDSTNDLYLYDSSPPVGKPKLVQASAGESIPDPEGHPVIGSGAGVLGVADVSMDGSRVYFVATGRLASEATKGANNLYVYERDATHPDGRIAFVATLASGEDSELWSEIQLPSAGKPAYALPRYVGEGSARLAGDGHVLLLLSQAQLLPTEDQDTYDDLYRYDDSSDQLVCLSCVGDKTIDVRFDGRDISRSLADEIQTQRIASEDGSEIIFRSREQLLAADTNTVQDVYLWDDGQLSLVSGATADSGVLDGARGPAISADGQSIFFLTRATLLSQDINNGGVDVYVARVGGGFPQQEVIAGCESEETCRSSSSAGGAAAGGATDPGTSVFKGPGNESSPVKKPCRKGKVRRGGRCVKPGKKKGKKNHHNQGGAGKRAAR
jgi:hypothetical protein